MNIIIKVTENMPETSCRIVVNFYSYQKLSGNAAARHFQVLTLARMVLFIIMTQMVGANKIRCLIEREG